MAFRLEPYPEDIDALVRADYPPEDVEEVFAILSGVADYLESERGWVQLVALARANGKKEQIQQWIDLGNTDLRDLKLSTTSFLKSGWERDYILRARIKRRSS